MKARKVSGLYLVLALLVLALPFGCKSGSGSTQTQTTVPVNSAQPGNWLEIEGSPGPITGALQMQMLGMPQINVTFSAQAVSFDGIVVVPAPPILPSGVTSATFQISRSGTVLRTVNLTMPVLQTPGAATLQFLQSIPQLGSALTPPSDPTEAAHFAKSMLDLNKLAVDMATLVTQAQSEPINIGAVGSVPLPLNTAALVTLDSLVLGAQAPVVPLTVESGTAAAGLSNGAVILGGIGLIALLPAEATLASALVAAAVGGTATGVILGTVTGMTAGQSLGASFSTALGLSYNQEMALATAYGVVSWAWVKALSSGPLSSDADNTEQDGAGGSSPNGSGAGGSGAGGSGAGGDPGTPCAGGFCAVGQFCCGKSIPNFCLSDTAPASACQGSG